MEKAWFIYGKVMKIYMYLSHSSVTLLTNFHGYHIMNCLVVDIDFRTQMESVIPSLKLFYSERNQHSSGVVCEGHSTLPLRGVDSKTLMIRESCRPQLTLILAVCITMDFAVGAVSCIQRLSWHLKEFHFMT